ncbi:hypothetical protein BDN70DRAFT_895800 [Pholiota conissans]|uniref:C2H2-type domain-containing protein n=1 Tax=Pholiota conissans TaxID=109636 RepID=A0A9P5Z207_9AGAR|nr:hypothetical protein BDN70DRAFT_895800 [Pholiota conissans]
MDRAVLGNTGPRYWVQIHGYVTNTLTAKFRHVRMLAMFDIEFNLECIMSGTMPLGSILHLDTILKLNEGRALDASAVLPPLPLTETNRSNSFRESYHPRLSDPIDDEIVVDCKRFDYDDNKSFATDVISAIDELSDNLSGESSAEDDDFQYDDGGLYTGEISDDEVVVVVEKEFEEELEGAVVEEDVLKEEEVEEDDFEDDDHEDDGYEDKDYIPAPARSAVAGPSKSRLQQSRTNARQTLLGKRKRTREDNEPKEYAPPAKTHRAVLKHIQPGQKKLVKCAKCEDPEFWATPGDMKRHMKSLAHSDPTCFCYCGAAFTRSDALGRHIKRDVHNKPKKWTRRKL